MKTAKGLLLAGLALALARGAYATDSDAGTSVSNLLAVQVAARPSAMANAFTAVGDDINTFYRNPGGLGFLRKSEALASRYTGLSGIDMNTLAVAIPLGDVTVSNVRSLGVVAVGLTNMHYGNSDQTDVTGARVGSFDANDQMLSVGWGRAYGSQLSIGAVAKLYRVEILKKGSSGTLVDVGAIYKLVPNYFQIGVLGSNLGSSVAYEGTGSDAPETIGAGAALMPLGNDHLTLTLDLERPSDASSVERVGIEVLPTSALALRAGYDSSYEAGPGYSFGAGIILANLEVGFFPVDRVTLDYSYTAGDDLDVTNRIALTCRIGTQ
jgi:hypothetical protein